MAACQRDGTCCRRDKKKHHIDGPANAVNIRLTEEEIQYLEEAYTAHPVTGTLLMI